jgi:2'-5' RNA ligase
VNKNGKYITLKPDEQTKAHLVCLIDKLNLDNPVKENDLHITLIYSKEITKEANNYKINQSKYTVNAAHFDLYGDNKDHLVIVINSEDLHEKHNNLKNNGFQHSYKKHNPHITIAFNTSKIPVDTLLKELSNEELVFEKEQVHDINKKTKPKNRP